MSDLAEIETPITIEFDEADGKEGAIWNVKDVIDERTGDSLGDIGIYEFDGFGDHFPERLINVVINTLAEIGTFEQKKKFYSVKVKREFQLEEAPAIEARFNIAPTQEILAIRQTSEGKEAVMLKWGLIPSWSKDASIGAELINARSETVEEKPSFREAFKRRRCIIPADGFYEWQRLGGRKQPFYFHLKDDRLFGFAGLWETWRTPDGERLETCSILTTEANAVLHKVHDRMPVILHPESYVLWLDEDVREQELRKELLCPFSASEMLAYPVSTAINNPQHQGEQLVQPIEG